MADIISKPLWDKLIDCEFYVGDKLFFNLKTPEHGLKPDIRFSWSRVPGHFTYNCKLEVINLFISDDWYSVTHIIVRAGYASGAKQSFSCQVFATYRPDAGPDSSIVFESIVANAEAGLLDAQPYLLKYVSPGYSIQKLCIAVASQMGLQCQLYLTKDLLDASFSDVVLEESFETGYQMWAYIYKILEAKAKGDGKTLQMIIFDQLVIFFEKEANGSLSSSTPAGTSNSEIPMLTNTLDATFTAGTLTVTAPWTPNIYPGSVFYCNPKRFTGGKALPNQVYLEGTYKDKTNMFYVITQDVVFETNGNRNQMKLMAVKASTSPSKSLTELSADGEQITDKAKQDAEAWKQNVAKLYEEKFKNKKEIRVGEEKKEEPEQVIVAGEEEPVKIPESWGAGFTGDSMSIGEVADKQRSIEGIARQYFGKMVSISWIRGNGNITSGGAAYNQMLGTCMILLATYKYWTDDTKLRSEYAIDTQNWNNLTATSRVVVPQISSWKILAKDDRIINHCNTLADFWQHEGSRLRANIYRDLADILQNAEIQN